MDPTTALMLARGSVLLTEKRDEGERGEDAVGMAAPLGDREGGRAPAGRDWWDGVGVALGERERESGGTTGSEKERGGLHWI
jgi:hypothetical protein